MSSFGLIPNRSLEGHPAKEELGFSLDRMSPRISLTGMVLITSSEVMKSNNRVMKWLTMENVSLSSRLLTTGLSFCSVIAATVQL